jgi:FtsZ-binding cell division protein ZapB
MEKPDFEKLVLEKFKLPLRYEPAGQMIFDAKDQLVCDVRAWGYLQRFENAEQLQDTLGEMMIARSFNCWTEHVEPLQAKLDFYREQTSKIREYVFNSKDIGEPNQNLFEAVTDKIDQLQAKVKELEEENNLLEEDKKEAFRAKDVLENYNIDLQEQNQKLREALKEAKNVLVEPRSLLGDKVYKILEQALNPNQG